MKVVFQRWWEAFSTARRNISMGLCIFRTAGGVFEVYVYVRLCVFAYTESRGCVFFGYVDVRMYELGFWESTQGGAGFISLSFTPLRPQQPGKLQSARGTALKKAKELWRLVEGQSHTDCCRLWGSDQLPYQQTPHPSPCVKPSSFWGSPHRNSSHYAPPAAS